MSDEASSPEGEKPRYLLPDGCRDLIDVLRRAKSDSERASGHGSGKPLGAPIETRGPTWVSMGIAALPRYIRWLFRSEKANVWLLISQDSDWRTFVAVMRTHGRLQFQCTSESGLTPERDEILRDIAATRSLPITVEEVVGPGFPNRIVFLLPSSSGLVTSICFMVLRACFGVQRSDRLLFDVFEFD